MSVTVTFYVWWLWPYLLAGVVLYVPLCWQGKRTGSISRTESWWSFLTHGKYRYSNRKRAWLTLRGFLAVVALWPLAAWEAIR